MSAALLITGLVEEQSTIGVGELRAFSSLVEDVSAFAPGAVGSAVRLSDILDRVKPAAAVTHCTVISADESYRASIPIGAVREGGWLAFGIGGGALPSDLGGPLRLTVADGSTLCWNVKDVAELHLAAQREPDDVPDEPPH